MPPTDRRGRDLLNCQAVLRVVGALLTERTDEWDTASRYLSIESLKTAPKDSPAISGPSSAVDLSNEKMSGATPLDPPST